MIIAPPYTLQGIGHSSSRVFLFQTKPSTSRRFFEFRCVRPTIPNPQSPRVYPCFSCRPDPFGVASSTSLPYNRNGCSSTTPQNGKQTSLSFEPHFIWLFFQFFCFLYLPIMRISSIELHHHRWPFKVMHVAWSLYRDYHPETLVAFCASSWPFFAASYWSSLGFFPFIRRRRRPRGKK